MKNTKKDEKILAAKMTAAALLVLALCFYWVTHDFGI